LFGCPGLTRDALATVSDLKELQILEIGDGTRFGDGLADELLMTVKGLQYMEELSICPDRALGVTDAGLRSLTSLKRLRRLDLRGAQGYTDEALADVMTGLPNLERVTFTFRQQPGRGTKRDNCDIEKMGGL